MRAVVAERPDGPDGLVVREVPRPEPRPGWALVRVKAFGLNRSEYKTLRGYAGDAVTFPRILGIELVGVVEAVQGEAPAVLPGETVAALMGEMGRAFDGGYAEYALVPEHQLIALDTKLPWDVLGALPETFVTAAGSLAHLDLEEGETLLLRGATSSVGLACLQLARSAGVRVIATTRSEAKGRRLTALGAAGIVLEGGGFAERARGALPEGGADGAVDLIGGPAVLETLRLLRAGATACNSGSLSDTWVIPDFEPIAMIPSGRKLTVFHSNDAHEARVGGRCSAPSSSRLSAARSRRTSTRSIRSSRRSTRTAGWQRTRRLASSSCCRAERPPAHEGSRRHGAAFESNTRLTMRTFFAYGSSTVDVTTYSGRVWWETLLQPTSQPGRHLAVHLARRRAALALQHIIRRTVRLTGRS